MSNDEIKPLSALSGICFCHSRLYFIPIEEKDRKGNCSRFPLTLMGTAENCSVNAKWCRWWLPGDLWEWPESFSPINTFVFTNEPVVLKGIKAECITAVRLELLEQDWKRFYKMWEQTLTLCHTHHGTFSGSQTPPTFKKNIIIMLYKTRVYIYNMYEQEYYESSISVSYITWLWKQSQVDVSIN